MQRTKNQFTCNNSIFTAPFLNILVLTAGRSHNDCLLLFTIVIIIITNIIIIISLFGRKACVSFCFVERYMLRIFSFVQSQNMNRFSENSLEVLCIILFSSIFGLQQINFMHSEYMLSILVTISSLITSKDFRRINIKEIEFILKKFGLN